jgi:hypothetical protein
MRVKWFRDREQKTRAIEEVQLLTAEFDRTIKSFKTMATTWNAVVNSLLNSSEPYSLGHLYFAHKQHQVWINLATQAQEDYNTARATAATEYEQLLELGYTELSHLNVNPSHTVD